MKSYILLSALTLGMGAMVRMSEKQAKLFGSVLKKTKSGYEVQRRVTFEPGTELDLDFSVSKQIALDVDDADRRASMIRAAADTLDPDKKSHFTDKGMPETEILSGLVGFKVTASERDKAMKAEKKN